MEISRQPIVFKVVYGDPTPKRRFPENVSSGPDTTELEVRKIVFASTPDFKQLYDKLLMVENEKYYNKDNSTSNLSRIDFRIRYIDEDEDFICIACNDDLHTAIQGMVYSLILSIVIIISIVTCYIKLLKSYIHFRSPAVFESM